MIQVGVLGAGQLGRMLALAGLPLELRCRFFDPAPDSPASHLAEQIVGSYDDTDLLSRFAAGLDVVTFEFENVPVACAQRLSQTVPIYPPPEALETAQDRLIEKTFFTQLGIPTPPFAPVETEVDLDSALQRIGLPAVLKTRRFGYDGKGQAILRNIEDRESAWDRLKGAPLILEGFVPFRRELSILAVRGRSGECRFYPLVENHHRAGILRLSLGPAPDLTTALQTQAEKYARRTLEALNYVGVLAVEFFEHDGQLIANEMAPRVHNSGHWTIEGAETSQFENHLRAVAGLPLGSTDAIGFSAMVNLIGELPNYDDVLALPGAHLHLYGKSPRPGRKLGHITLRTDDEATLSARLKQIARLIPESVLSAI